MGPAAAGSAKDRALVLALKNEKGYESMLQNGAAEGDSSLLRVTA
jgi:hypothetical protein